MKVCLLLFIVMTLATRLSAQTVLPPLPPQPEGRTAMTPPALQKSALREPFTMGKTPEQSANATAPDKWQNMLWPKPYAMQRIMELNAGPFHVALQKRIRNPNFRPQHRQGLFTMFEAAHMPLQIQVKKFDLWNNPITFVGDLRSERYSFGISEQRSRRVTVGLQFSF